MKLIEKFMRATAAGGIIAASIQTCGHVNAIKPEDSIGFRYMQTPFGTPMRNYLDVPDDIDRDRYLLSLIDLYHYPIDTYHYSDCIIDTLTP